MKKGFVKKNKIFGINMFYILSLLPVIIFSFYKNGILAYKGGAINLFLATQYLVIPIIIIILSYVFEAYYYLGYKKEKDTNNVINSLVPYINTLCYLLCGPATRLYISIPIIVVLDIAMKFIDNKFTVNRVCLFKCILFGLLILIGKSSNMNYYEMTLGSNDLSLGALFIGKGIGEIGVTSTLCALIGFVVLLFNTYYKKDIPIVCFICYVLVSVLLYFANVVNFNELMVNTFNSGVIFAFVFVASLSNGTPVVRSGRLIYSILVGIICGIMVHLVDFYVGIYFAILVLSLISPILNKVKITVQN